MGGRGTGLPHVRWWNRGKPVKRPMVPVRPRTLGLLRGRTKGAVALFALRKVREGRKGIQGQGAKMGGELEISHRGTEAQRYIQGWQEAGWG